MMDIKPNDKILLAAGSLGADAEDFLKSELGQTLIALAREEAIGSLSKLRTVSSWRRRRIAQLQADVWRAESFEGWLKSLIARGKVALREYDRRTAETYEEDSDGTPNADAPEIAD